MKKINTINSIDGQILDFLKHPFTLSNLVDLIPAKKIFQLEVSEIQIHAGENITFGTQFYTIKLPKSDQNHKRIMYYSLLCYLYEMMSTTATTTTITTITISQERNHFVNQIISKLQIILPNKQSQKILQMKQMPLLTTGQMKSCFVKFISLLTNKQLQPKSVLQQLILLPQMDFVMMSIMQMIFKKDKNVSNNGKMNSNCMVSCLDIIQEFFGIKGKITQTGYILNEKCQVQFKSSDQKYDKFFIRKVQQPKVKKNKVLRKQTIESVGNIDENDDDNEQRQQQKDQNFLFPQIMMNARFVQSYQTQQLENLGNLENDLQQEQENKQQKENEQIMNNSSYGIKQTKDNKQYLIIPAVENTFYKNVQNVQCIQNLQNLQNVQNVEIVENVQHAQHCYAYDFMKKTNTYTSRRKLNSKIQQITIIRNNFHATNKQKPFSTSFIRSLTPRKIWRKFQPIKNIRRIQQTLTSETITTTTNCYFPNPKNNINNYFTPKRSQSLSNLNHVKDDDSIRTTHASDKDVKGSNIQYDFYYKFYLQVYRKCNLKS